MNENMEYNEFEQRNNIRDRMFDIWSKYKKHLIVLACFIILLTIVLVIVLNRPKTYTKYPDIERIMIINAQNYAKNNNLANNSYISLNNLNIKIDENLKCDSLSGVYKEKDSYSPYLICDNYQSESIKDVLENNKDNIEYGELKGSNPYVLNGVNYIEEGIENKNSYKVNIKGDDIDNGLNIVTYSITNNGKYLGELKRIVIAEDIVGSIPTIELLGEKTRTIPKGSVYKETGYDAKDERDGNITDKVKVTGSVDTSKAGTYKITYSVTNSKGKTASAERTIIVNETNNIDFTITHKLTPETVTEKSVTITVNIKGNGYKHTVLPDNSEIKSNEVSYIVYKNGTYDFVIYDTNNNSEVYTVKVSNIDDGVKGTCTGEYENGYGFAKLTFKLTSGKPKTYKFLSDGKVLQSGTETTYKATNDFTLLINPTVVVTNTYGRDTTISCSVKHQDYITYRPKGYYFQKKASLASKAENVANPYPKNEISYYLHVPAGVTKDDKLPLIIGLHGGFGWGVSCNGSTTIEAYQTYHYYKSVFYSGKSTINFVSNPDVRAVIITPSSMTCNWEPSVLQAIKIMYAYIKLYNIDFDNIVVTGISQGGYGTLYMGFLEEQVIYRATEETSLSTIAKEYNTTVDEIIAYNSKIKTNINYGSTNSTVRSGSLTVVRAKTKDDQRSLFSMLVPLSPAKNDSRCSFTPTTIYDDTGKKCSTTPPYTLKTPIWIVTSMEEYSNIQKFAKELTAYYGPKGNIRYTLLTNLKSIHIDNHNTDQAIFGRTAATYWILKQKYGQVRVTDDEELSQIEQSLGANFKRVWTP